MTDPRNDGRSPWVVAMQWVNQITTVSLEMTLPAALGYWLDQKWQTEPWLVAVGAVLGFITAMTHLLQLTRSSHGSRFRQRDGKKQ